MGCIDCMWWRIKTFIHGKGRKFISELNFRKTLMIKSIKYHFYMTHLIKSRFP